MRKRKDGMEKHFLPYPISLLLEYNGEAKKNTGIRNHDPLPGSYKGLGYVCAIGLSSQLCPFCIARKH